MTFGPTAGDFTIAGSASVSNIINGGGRSLAGLIFPKEGWTGTGFSLKESLTETDLMAVYDSAGTVHAVTVPAAGSSAILVKLNPQKYHTMQNIQLVASSAQSSAIIVKPVWTRYNPRG